MPPWLAALIASFIGTGAVRAYALRARLLDLPDDNRRNHRVPTPRGGGIAICAVVVAALGALACLDPGQRIGWAAWALAVGLAGGVGAWDDHHPLSVRLRLATHLMAAGFGAVGVLAMGGPPWAAMMSLLAIPLLLNFWNFMDGIDGIAASQAVIVAVAAACLLDAEWRLFAQVGAAAAFGFLVWNFPRARIFMGDAGSGTLGVLVACLWAGCALQSRQAALVLLFPMAACLVDAGLTLSLRFAEGEAWWRPHSRHSYQLATRRAGRHWPVTLAYAAWSTLGAVIGTRLVEFDNIFIMSWLAAWYTATVIGWIRLRRGSGTDPTRSTA